MDFEILYDKEHRTISSNGKSAYSDILYVPPGKTALLSLYNMYSEASIKTDPVTGKKVLSSNDCVVVHKLSFGQTGDIARKISCGENVDITRELKQLLYNRRLFHEPVFQCGDEWTISSCNNYALLPTPGFFMLELVDTNQFDTAYIEYALLSVPDSMIIPDDFKFGSK